MLRKQICTLHNAPQADKKLPLIIEVEQEQQFQDALSILDHHSHPLRGISLPQQFLTTLPLLSPFVTYLRIHVQDLSTIEHLLNSIALKKRFLEVFIPIELLQNPEQLKYCQRAHRIVIKISQLSDLSMYTQLYSQFLLLSHYPLFIGAPLCAIEPEHCYEFFDQINAIIPPKPAACTGCLFINHCPFDQKRDGTKFIPKPRTEQTKYNDALTFLNAQTTTHENTPARV